MTLHVDHNGNALKNAHGQNLHEIDKMVDRNYVEVRDKMVALYDELTKNMSDMKIKKFDELLTMMRHEGYCAAREEIY